jgi:16S rRNA (uracil1498-N3)-methyltransferase
MPPRFLADSIDVASSTAHLSADEARHFSQVLRLDSGDEIAVFDGAGREFLARVEEVDRNGATVRLLEPIEPAAEPAVRMTLAQAYLKGEKMDDVVRDATMMGVTVIAPLVTEHTVRHPRTHDRWKKIAVSSAKQCGRAVVPPVGAATTFAEWLPADTSAMRLMLVEPSASIEGHPLSTLAGDRPESATLLVGPEGGWSSGEIEAAVRAGYLPITIGHRTLRADAVPIVAIGLLQFVWGDL